MDPSFLNNLVTSIRDVLLRSSGSKRLMAFFAWLVYDGWTKPNWNELCFSAVSLWFLWLLFQNDTPAEAKADALTEPKP